VRRLAAIAFKPCDLFEGSKEKFITAWSSHVAHRAILEGPLPHLSD
jgi:hypothetical protein